MAVADPPGGLIAVVAAVILDDLVVPTRLLSAQRTEPPELAGGWEIPGGKVDPGESPRAALHREIREELGVRIRIGESVPGPFEGGGPLGERYAMRVWLAQVTHGIPQPLEDHADVRWLGPRQVWSLDWLPANRPVIEAVLATVWNSPPGN